MMLPILPIIIPLLTGLIGLLALKPSLLRRRLFALSATVQLLLSIHLIRESYHEGPVALYLGGWGAPLGITVVLDLLSAIMVGLASVMALAAVLFGFKEMSAESEHPLRLPLLQFLVVGMNLSFLTGDLFNLFVAFEVMLLSSYALLTLEADDWDVRQAFPYVAINIFGSALFLVGCGFTYGLFGSLNYADIAMRSQEMLIDGQSPLTVEMLALLMVFVFGIKAGLFPLYFWLPNSYPVLSPALFGLFSAMLSKVGVYVLLRFLGTVMPHDLDFIYTLLGWVGGATMLFAVLGTVPRNSMRHILSFHILSQIGYMVFAISFFTPYGFATSIFFVAHNALVKGSLCLCAGVVTFLCGSDDLKKAANLWKLAPLFGIVFFIQAMSLAGIPPLSGFWGKYMIIVEGLRQGAWVLVGVAVVTSVLTLFSMLKIWLAVFWTEDSKATVRTADRRWLHMTAIIAGVMVISLFIGFGAQYFIELTMEAANQVMDREAYVDRVLLFRELP